MEEIKKLLADARLTNDIERYSEKISFYIQYNISSSYPIELMDSLPQMLYNLHAENWSNESLSDFLVEVWQSYKHVMRSNND
jgi:hypothetical protein